MSKVFIKNKNIGQAENNGDKIR
jgi:hypothetical protein